MTTTPFEIKVVYDASRKRRGTAIRTSAVRQTQRPGAGLVLGAMLNLVVAAAMYYAIWWKADPFLYITMIKKTPMDVPPSFAANPLGLATPEDLEPRGPEPSTASNSEANAGWSGKTAQVVIPAAAYGWLVLATASAFAVALVGGAWLGAIGGHWIRVAGLIGLLALVGGVGFFAYKIWAEYEMMYKPDQLRAGMGWLTLLVALLGLAAAARARGITKLAAVVVLIAAAGTPVGLWLWNQCGALDPQFANWSWMAAAFVIHAAWGIVLLVMASRIRA